MATTNSRNPGGTGPHDSDNQKQQQARQSEERKHSLQSGSNAGRNNHSPRKGDKGERHQDLKNPGRG